jgi:hypothetical protein
MKEDFLHYLWRFKKFDSTQLTTFNGEEITIVSSGQYLQLAGPDFFNAQIIIGRQKWAGNIEIHLKSSDWYLHNHESDPAYENVILHVVWEHDSGVFRNNNTEIPVLELKHFVAQETVESYERLTAAKSWIFCERQISSVDPIVLRSWQERLFFERLEKKSAPVNVLLSENGNDWEATFFSLLAKNFGLNTNGDAFFEIAHSIPFSVIRKESANPENLEALLLGRAGLLSGEKEDAYFISLQDNYALLCQKHVLDDATCGPVQFFKHRPDNFPNIRLSQLAQLYSLRPNLFSQAIVAPTTAELYGLFRVDVSEYWQSHYQFDRESPKRRKQLTDSFIDLLLVNTVIPVRFAFAVSHGEDNIGALVDLAGIIAAEKNAVIDKFASFGLPAESAFETQSLLQLKNEYCTRGRCLECAIGIELLKPPDGAKNFVTLAGTDNPPK